MAEPGQALELMLAESGTFDNCEDNASLSWRRPEFADWEFVVGSNVYKVHKAVLGAGPRKSEFFKAAFNDSYGKSSSDLSNLLPGRCWPHFEEVLDFIYEDKFEPHAENIVPMFKLGHVLRIRKLCEVSVGGMKSLLNQNSARVFLAHALELSPGLEHVASAAYSTIAPHMEDHYEPADFEVFPLEVFVALLSHERLRATESTKSNLVAYFLRRHPDISYTDFVELVQHVSTPAPEDLLVLLGKSCELQHQESMESSLRIAAHCFDQLRFEDICALTNHEVICRLLDSDNLCTDHEDMVFNVILKYTEFRSSELAEAAITELWSCCRFAWLSPMQLELAQQHARVPREPLELGMLASIFRLRSDSSSQMDTFLARCDQSKPSAARRLRQRLGSLPSAPSSLVVDVIAGKESLSFSWAPASSPMRDPITEYVLEIDDGDGGDFREIYRGARTTFTAGGLKPTVQHRSRVKAGNLRGFGPCTVPVVSGPVQSRPGIHLRFQFPFDTSGLFYYLGTNAGRQSWVNPAAAGQVVVSSSGWKNGKSVIVVENKPTRTGNYTRNDPCSWVAVDIGPGRALRCDHYCFRSDNAGREKLRNWELQASLDGASWTVLRRHEQDTSLSDTINSEAAWPVNETPVAYRYFRILQFGPNSEPGANKHTLACTGFELYGILMNSTQILSPGVPFVVAASEEASNSTEECSRTDIVAGESPTETVEDIKTM